MTLYKVTINDLDPPPFEDIEADTPYDAAYTFALQTINEWSTAFDCEDYLEIYVQHPDYTPADAAATGPDQKDWAFQFDVDWEDSSRWGFSVELGNGREVA